MYFDYLDLKSMYYGIAIADSYDLTGYLNPAEFTTNSPISYREYTGPKEDEFDYKEYARESLVSLVSQLAWYLQENEVGITIADLGFTSF